MVSKDTRPWQSFTESFSFQNRRSFVNFVIEKKLKSIQQVLMRPSFLKFSHHCWIAVNPIVTLQTNEPLESWFLG